MPALSEGLRQSLDGLVNAVHRTINTNHKKFGAGGAQKAPLGGSDQSARSSRGSGGGSHNHFLELEADQGSGQAYNMSASPRRISAQLDSDIGFAGQHAQVQVVSRPHSPMRATQQQPSSSPYNSRPVSPMQRLRDIDAGPPGSTGATRMWTYASDSCTGSVHLLREAQDASSGVRILSEAAENATGSVQILREATDATAGVQIVREAVPYRGEGPPRANLAAAPPAGGSGAGSDSGLLAHSRSECSPMTSSRALQGVSILRARPPYSATASPPLAGKGGGGSAALPHGAVHNRGRLRLESSSFPCGSLR